MACEALQLQTPTFVKSSTLAINTKSDDALIDICQHENATEYLSGQGGKKYQHDDKFESKGISVTYDFFKHPTYPQLWGDFVPGMSILDLLLNCGEDSHDILQMAVR